MRLPRAGMTPSARRRIGAVVLVPLGAMSLCAAQSAAAVRICKENVASPRVTAASESAARKGALDAWKEKALIFGEGYESWRLASGKFLECLPAKAGTFECIASGAPCKLEHAPSRRHLREKRIGI